MKSDVERSGRPIEVANAQLLKINQQYGVGRSENEKALDGGNHRHIT